MRSNSRSWLNVLGLFGLVTAIFTYGFHTFLRVQPSADLDTHISFAEQIRSIADLTSPHFLFQLLLKALHLAGSDYAPAAVWVLGLTYGAMAVLIAREMERRGAELTAMRAFVLIPALLIAAHVFLPTIVQPNMYFGYFVPIAYHNPTQQLNKLFTVWIYFAYCADFLDSDRASPPRVAGTGALCVLSALAKPSFLLAFLPTAGLFALADGVRRRWRQVVLFSVAIALPSVLVLLWQVRLAYGTAAPTSIVFAPFEVFEFEQTLYKLPASFAFPLVVWVMAARSRRHDVKLHFVWLFTALALLVTLFLAESGPRLMEGNFAWTGQTAVFLAYVESFLWLMTTPEVTWGRRAAWWTFGAHVACGIIWYAANFIPERMQWL